MSVKIQVEVSEALPKDLLISEVAVVVKCVDKEGISRLAIRTSEGLAVWDAVGMLQIAADVSRKAAQEEFSELE